MKFVRLETEERVVTHNLNQGHHRNYFTKEEQEAFWQGKVEKVNGCYSYEVQVRHLDFTTHLIADREYVEGKLGLRPLLRIIKRLSKGDRGALSKQLFPYYEKVAISKLSPDFSKHHQPKNLISLVDLNNRTAYHSHVSIRMGKSVFYAYGDGKEALGDIGRNHLKRCIAILREKGYIAVENKKYAKNLKGWRYDYSDTYYKLTNKAEKLIAGAKC
jgi:hypothetical protein